MATVLGFEITTTEPAFTADYSIVRQFLQNALSDHSLREQVSSMMSRLDVTELATASCLLDSFISVEKVRAELENRQDNNLAEQMIVFYWSTPACSERSREKLVACASYLYAGEPANRNSSLRFRNYLEGLLPPMPEGSINGEPQTKMFDSLALEIEKCEKIADLATLLRTCHFLELRAEALRHPLSISTLASIAKCDRVIGETFDRMLRDVRSQVRGFMHDIETRLSGDEGKCYATVQASTIVSAMSKDTEEIASLFVALDDSVREFATSKLAPKEFSESTNSQSDFDLSPKDPDKEQQNKLSDVRLAMLDTVRRSTELNVIQIETTTASATLNRCEIEAIRAPYIGEDSFRGMYTDALSQNAVLRARMARAVADFEKHRNSSWLWQNHAGALRFLHGIGIDRIQGSRKVEKLCAERGLIEKASALHASSRMIEQLSKTIAEFMPELAEVHVSQLSV